MLHYGRNGEIVRVDVLDEGGPEPELGPDPATALFMGLKSAAERLGVDPSSLRRSAARGTLRATRLGDQWITTPAWLEEFKAKRRGPGRPRKSA